MQGAVLASKKNHSADGCEDVWKRFLSHTDALILNAMYSFTSNIEETWENEKKFGEYEPNMTKCCFYYYASSRMHLSHILVDQLIDTQFPSQFHAIKIIWYHSWIEQSRLQQKKNSEINKIGKIY